jgi:hypothetical protein
MGLNILRYYYKQRNPIICILVFLLYTKVFNSRPNPDRDYPTR